MPLRKWPPRLLDWRTVIGEVLIIVLGVMLALGVDRWAGERRDQDTAMQYVARLRTDLDTDLLGYDQTVAWSQAIDQSALYVLDVYRGRNPASDESDQFLQHLYRASWAVMGNTTSATYEELVSTGNMALLPVEVRGAVTEYYALKTNYLENRRQIFEEKAIAGYWPVPSAVLGPDLAPDAWLAAQGGGPGAQFDEPVTPGLSNEDLEAILGRLRDIETLEADLADIRHQMAQRTVLFGARLPAAARDRDLLLIAGWDDEQVEIEYQVLPFYRSLKRADAKTVRIVAYQDDHSFQSVRSQLAAAIHDWLLQSPAR